MAALSLDQFTGLDTVHDRARVADDKLVALRNFNLTEQGYLKRRSGFFTFTDTALQAGKSINLLARYTTSAWDRLIYSVDVDADLFYISFSGGGSVNITTTLPAFPQWAAQYGEDLYISYMSQKLQRLDDTTLTTSSATDPHSFGTHLVFWKDRGWLVNTNTNFDILRYSEIASFMGTTDWANSEEISFGDGDYLTCTVPFNDQLIIFKSKSTWMLDTGGSATPADWIMRMLNPNIGCISRSTPVVFENLLYFESHDGVYRTDLSNFEELSSDIRSEFVRREVIRQVTTYADYAVIHNDKYVLFTNDGTLRRFWVYDLKVGGWSEYRAENTSTYRPKGMFVFHDQSPGSLYFGNDSSQGHIFRYGDPTILRDMLGTTASDFTAFLQTKYLDMDASSTWKRLKRANLDFNGTSPNIKTQWHYPNNLSSAENTLTPSGGPQESFRSIAPLPIVPRFQSVSFSLSDLGEKDLSVYSLNLDVAERDVVAREVGK